MPDRVWPEIDPATGKFIHQPTHDYYGAAAAAAVAAASSAASAALDAQSAALDAQAAAGLVGAPAGAAVDAAIAPGGAARATLETAVGGLAEPRAHVRARSETVANYGPLGGADDTATIQAALADAAAGKHLVFPAAANLNVTQAVISNHLHSHIDGNGVTLTLLPTGGARKVGIDFAGTCEGVTVSGFRIKGSGLLADLHGGIRALTNDVLKGVQILGNTVEDCTLGISVDTSAGGETRDLLISGNRVVRVVGVDPGQGYGIHYGALDTYDSSARIVHNFVDDSGRHAYYVARGRGVIVADNVSVNHRATVGGSSGRVRAALNINRSREVIADGNLILNATGGALHVAGQELAGDTTGNITVSDNVASSAGLDGVPVGIVGLVGALGGATPPSDVAFIGNRFIGYNTEAFRLYMGLDVEMRGNRFQVVSATAQTIFRFMGIGGDAFTDGVDMVDNTFVGRGGATHHTIRLNGVEAFTGRMRFDGNRHRTGGNMFIAASDVSNPNMEVTNQESSGLTMAGGVSNTAPRFRAPVSTTATAGAATLPAAPVGFVTTVINGATVKIPYYS